MVRIEQVVDEIVNVLRNNITDPISLRRERGLNWIFPGFPRYDAGTPRIGITYISSPLEALAIGTPHRRHNARFQITILVRETDKIDIDGDGEKESPEFVADYIANEVIKAVMDNQSSFTTCWRITIENQAVMRRDGYYYMILEAEAILERGES